MKNSTTILTIILNLLFCFSLAAQQQLVPTPVKSVQSPTYTQSSTPVNYYQAPTSTLITIHTGTPIQLETLYPINGKNLSQGQTIDLRVKYDVVIDGYRVISAGAPARAIVSSVRKRKMFGKAGEIQLLPQYVQMADGQFLPVTGMPTNFEGKNRKDLAWGGVAAGVLTGGAGFLALPFIKGKAAEIPAGTALHCSVMGTRQLAVQAAQP